MKKVQKCAKCSFRAHHVEQGANFDYCGAPGSPDGYESRIPVKRVHRDRWDWLEDKTKFPPWCPLPVTIERVTV